MLALLASIFFALFCNRLLWDAALAGCDPGHLRTWIFAASILVILVALHYLVVAPLLTRWNTKPVLLMLLAATGLAVHFMNRYNVYLDPGMLRNVLATDSREAADLLTWSLLPHLLLFVGIPAWLLSRLIATSRVWIRSS